MNLLIITNKIIKDNLKFNIHSNQIIVGNVNYFISYKPLRNFETLLKYYQNITEILLKYY